MVLVSKAATRTGGAGKAEPVPEETTVLLISMVSDE